tara:strand:+ start:1435 stop:1875 length:441 start_codon:yes stop_codon:yes gene_type:complete
MKNPTPEQIGNKVIEMSGIDIYKNTRQNDYVEHRALMCYLMRDKLHMRWTHITRFFNSQGKKMHHSTAIHLLEMYPVYKKYNSDLATIEDCFFFDAKTPHDSIDEVTYLEKKCENLENECLELREQLANPVVQSMLAVIKANKFVT